MTLAFENLIRAIRASCRDDGIPILVGIDGRGGAGKTTLARALGERLSDFSVMHGDDYWEPSTDSDFGWFNEDRFDHDVLEPLRGRSSRLSYRPYVWASQPHISEVDFRIQTGVIIERCYAMAFDLPWDLTIWVDIDVEVAHRRGAARNPVAAEIWATVWRPREDAYLAATHADQVADIRFDGFSRVACDDDRMLIRPAAAADWHHIWAFFQEITRAGETYVYDPEMPESQAREMWLAPPPDHAVVALDDQGEIVGSAKMGANRAGGGAHVATASFMVAGAAAGRGIGRTLGQYALDWARTQGFRAMQFNAVVESNTRAVALWQALGFEIIGTVPEGFRRPSGEYVGLHIMYRTL